MGNPGQFWKSRRVMESPGKTKVMKILRKRLVFPEILEKVQQLT